MSTTTGHDLLARAEALAKELAHCDLPVKTAAWESFDTTVYRLLREVIGPARSDSGATTQTRTRLLHVIHSYPTPLRPPLDTELTAAAAARFVPWSDTQFRERIHRGDVEATITGHTYAIESRVLDRRTDIAPADPTDAHPLARLSTTLGALADMASQERREPRTPGAMDDQAAVDVSARVLSYTSVAARYTLRHGPVVDGERPLAVAQYAERSVDALGAAPSKASLDALVARIETNGTEPHERLDSAIQRWSTASHAELSRTIPSTQVMANIADLGAMMLAATHHLRTVEPHTTGEGQGAHRTTPLRRRRAQEGLDRLEVGQHPPAPVPRVRDSITRALQRHARSHHRPRRPGARQCDDPRCRSGAAQPRARGRRPDALHGARSRSHPRLRPQRRPLRARPGPPPKPGSPRRAPTRQSRRSRAERGHGSACPGVGVGANTGVAPGDSASWSARNLGDFTGELATNPRCPVGAVVLLRTTRENHDSRGRTRALRHL